MKYINPVISGFYPDPSICVRLRANIILFAALFSFFRAFLYMKATTL